MLFLPMFDLIVLFLLYVLVWLPKWYSSPYSLFLHTCWYVYLCGVAYVTLLPYVIPIPMINWHPSQLSCNLVPFLDVLSGHGGAWKEICLNLLMMVPFGILYPLLYHRGFLTTMKAVFLCSLTIELLQLCQVQGFSVCDITDLCNNTLGGFIGYGIYAMFHPLAKRILTSVFSTQPFQRPFPFSISIKWRNLILALLVFFFVFRSLIFSWV